MEKDQIISRIKEKHAFLFSWLDNNGNKFWDYGPEGKWTTGQHIIHLVQSLKPTNKAMVIPKVVLKLKFGKSNRTPRPYNKVKERYLEKLSQNLDIVSPFSKEMPSTPSSEMQQWIDELGKEKEKLIKTINSKWSDKDLDSCLIPHPLMGKMPVREFLMWTAYHTEHHTRLIIERAELSKI